MLYFPDPFQISSVLSRKFSVVLSLKNTRLGNRLNYGAFPLSPVVLWLQLTIGNIEGGDDTCSGRLTVSEVPVKILFQHHFDQPVLVLLLLDNLLVSQYTDLVTGWMTRRRVFDSSRMQLFLSSPPNPDRF